MSDLDPDVRDEVDHRRYALDVEGATAVVTYNLVQGGLMVTETLVPIALEGRGIASRLARHVLADVKARGLVILPVCPFFAGYLKKHPEWAEVVHPTYRATLGI
ncbi:MAG TPA: GNAT family N-acetyltransferase [Brevundimonas sp.]|uniref:GNAT family N-acetyltransferase n=1 Tax=Brevundimonas sp. TaxID=1871086 RepID=UPI002B577465|nr:GNAT family N-acetyltransferase [Brevundimonas sp.]HRH19779.1 GNAT family N-acetyltransferase [Brevundimonas sp.]